MNLTFLTTTLELVGSAAFAVSGVIVAKKKKMDLFGAILLGCITAVGGGFFRDLILGITPPLMFSNPMYVTCAAIVSVLTFILEYRDKSSFEVHKSASEKMLNMTDSIGLAIFAIMGVRTATEMGFSDNHFLCVFVGTLTGIGGGILRDMLAGEMPLILRERVYGVAAIIGSCVFLYCSFMMSEPFAMGFSFFATVFIRFCAIHYEWNLPRLK